MSKNIEVLLHDYEFKLMSADDETSFEELDNLISDDFFEFGSSGKIYNKREVIDFLLDRKKIKSNLTEFKIRFVDDEIVFVTYTAEVKLKSGISKHSLRSSIWRKNTKGYQIFFHQGTPKPDA